ncbi:hypothetical protein ACLOJK_034671 [Asimina triloba]
MKIKARGQGESTWNLERNMRFFVKEMTGQPMKPNRGLELREEASGAILYVARGKAGAFVGKITREKWRAECNWGSIIQVADDPSWGHDPPVAGGFDRRDWAGTVDSGPIAMSSGTLLIIPRLSLPSGDVAVDYLIELTNGVRRVKTKLTSELMVSFALDEGRHVEPRHIISEWFVGTLVDTHKLGSSDRLLPLVAESSFELVDELLEADDGARGKGGKSYLSLLVQGGREGYAFEPLGRLMEFTTCPVGSDVGPKTGILGISNLSGMSWLCRANMPTGAKGSVVGNDIEINVMRGIRKGC